MKGLGFRVEGLGFKVKGLGLRVQCLGLKVEGSEFSVYGVGGREESDLDRASRVGVGGRATQRTTGLSSQFNLPPRN